MRNSLTKPFNGGRPQMATAPTRKQSAVHGIVLARPPRWSISRVCVAWMTEPALRNSSALKSAWFQTCSRPPPRPRTTQSGRSRRTADHGQAEAHDDDADVLDAVISQQPFQVVLADGEGDSQDARDHAQPQDDRRPIPAADAAAATSPGPGRKCPS